MTAFAMVGDAIATHVRVHVPSNGPWFADVDFEQAPELTGAVTLRLGELELHGTIDPRYDGTRGLQRFTRIVAGAGAWATLLRARAYHSDAGVRAITVAQDAAREIGEQLGGFTPAVDPVGVDYVRQSGPAARVLEDVIGGAQWWVDYDGVTQVGTRPSSQPTPDTYEVLDYQPRDRVVLLAVDDLGAVTIGATLSERLDAPQVVRELELLVEPEGVRVRAWCGGTGTPLGRLIALMRSIVRRELDDRLHGLWRYRVVSMDPPSAEPPRARVQLQAISSAAGLPDILPISMRPGVAGVHAELAAGTEVLVAFVEGDRTRPVIVGFAGLEGPGWSPERLTLDASQLLYVGAGATEGAALGTSLKSWLDDHTHGYLGDSGVPANTTGPVQAGYAGGPGVPDPSPSPSSKVRVE